MSAWVALLSCAGGYFVGRGTGTGPGDRNWYMVAFGVALFVASYWI